MNENQILTYVTGFVMSSGLTLAIVKGFLKSQVEEVVKPLLDERDTAQQTKCELRQKLVDNEVEMFQRENSRLSDSLIRLEGKLDSLIILFTHKPA